MEATGVAMNFDGDYKGFKIFASSDGWWPWYGQTPDAPFGTVIRIDDQATSDAKGDPQFYPSRFGYASGTYTINLNLNTMTLTSPKRTSHVQTNPEGNYDIIFSGSATIGSAANDTMPLHSG
ncbi:MAG: hypothetical protein ACLRM8_00625 [Alistipes sp.]